MKGTFEGRVRGLSPRTFNIEKAVSSGSDAQASGPDSAEAVDVAAESVVEPPATDLGPMGSSGSVASGSVASDSAASGSAASDSAASDSAASDSAASDSAASDFAASGSAASDFVAIDSLQN